MSGEEGVVEEAGGKGGSPSASLGEVGAVDEAGGKGGSPSARWALSRRQVAREVPLLQLWGRWALPNIHVSRVLLY
jgi:hypothetical protein